MSNVPPGVRIIRVALDHPDAQRLIADVQAFYASLYGGSGDETPLAPDYFEPPQGAFFVLYAGDEAVATGAWRMRPDVGEEFGLERPAEIKRMYVVPSRQRTGLGRLVLAHLEATAREAGAATMILETGAPQVAGIGLYTSSGYAPMESFGHYRWSDANRCFAKPLPR